MFNFDDDDDFEPLDLDGDGQVDAFGQDIQGDSSLAGKGAGEEGLLAGSGSDLNDDGILSYMEMENDSIHIGREPYYDETYGLMPAQYDTDSGTEGIIGDPAADTAHWHMQTHDDTCAVVSQEFVLEELTGQEFSEDELMKLAEEQGWYTPGGGTTMDNVGKLLEYHGLDVERSHGTIESLQSALANGDKVIVGIDSGELASNGAEALDDQLESVMGIPDTDADHAVEVIGIDYSDSEHPMVILNDPGHPGGQGSMIPLELFQQAWADSGNFMVTASN